MVDHSRDTMIEAIEVALDQHVRERDAKQAEPKQTAGLAFGFEVRVRQVGDVLRIDVKGATGPSFKTTFPREKAAEEGS